MQFPKQQNQGVFSRIEVPKLCVGWCNDCLQARERCGPYSCFGKTCLKPSAHRNKVSKPAIMSTWLYLLLTYVKLNPKTDQWQGPPPSRTCLQHNPHRILRGPRVMPGSPTSPKEHVETLEPRWNLRPTQTLVNDLSACLAILGHYNLTIWLSRPLVMAHKDSQ